MAHDLRHERHHPAPYWPGEEHAAVLPAFAAKYLRIHLEPLPKTGEPQTASHAYSLGDISLFHLSTSNYSLMVNIQGLGEVNLDLQYLGGDYAVENLHFLSDNSTLTLTDLTVTTVGTAGNDSLSAPSINAGPDDIMDGREGDDYLSAGTGNDSYVFSAGHDIISDTGGNDTIKVCDDYAPGDLSIAFVQYNNADTALQLTDSDGNTIIVDGQSYSADSSVEHIVFSDTTVWNLSTMELDTLGTSGNDSYLSGHDIGDASSNDTIYGYAGDDSINGGNGDDVLYGMDGIDTANYSTDPAGVTVDLSKRHSDGRLEWFRHSYLHRKRHRLGL